MRKRKIPGAEMSVRQAVEEAHRCLLCHDAPCSAACPGGTDPGRFIRQIRFYNLKGAARTVMANNPFGGVCARVCSTAETCAGACVRAGLDRPIRIGELQSFAVDYGRRHGVKPSGPAVLRRQRVAVVGAGPAGLSAAACLVAYGYKVTVFEARAKAGGMMRYGIPGERLDAAVLEADLRDLLRLGVRVCTRSPIVKKGGVEGLLKRGFAAVFVAPGLWKPARLSIPGIDLKGVATAIEFFGATRASAARLVRGRNVAVIGGGSSAMDAANQARRLGTRKIYAIALEGMTELPARAGELETARRDGVIFKPQCRVREIIGLSGKVVGVEGVETEWIRPGSRAPRNARDVRGTGFLLRVGAVIQAIGRRPDDTVAGFSKAARGGRLWVVDRKTQATSSRRVFAGGDIVRGAATVVEAVGDGRRAAAQIHREVSK